MDYRLIVATLAAAVRSGTPILFAVLGEIMTERAGVLNLGLEGLMLIGALSGFMAAYLSSNLWFAVIIAMLMGGLFSLLFAVLTV
ncbi:MAG TPA: ABC transporter permease, partial [Spirochaetota bacterium]|nr:ABC transporter permease [Spirochaetota bacterium]